MSLHPVTGRVTARIAERSRRTRDDYLARIDAPARRQLSCGNLAHGFAASGGDKPMLKTGAGGNFGIVTAYNDMLSAHQPMEQYPTLIRMAARNAGGVPAMCDGVTQRRIGMQLSLFSRDTIALATAVSLSHEMFDAALMLGGARQRRRRRRWRRRWSRPGCRSWKSPCARRSRFRSSAACATCPVPSYFALPNVITVGGSWMVPNDALKAKDWARIDELAKAAAALRG